MVFISIEEYPGWLQVEGNEQEWDDKVDVGAAAPPGQQRVGAPHSGQHR